MRGLGVILGVLITGAGGAAAHAQERGPIAAAGEALAERYGKAYAPVEAGAAPAVAPYALPVDPKKIANPEALEALGLAEEGEARKALLAQGFVVLLRRPFRDDPIAFYEWVDRIGVPLYASADSVLHLYHIQFDELLKGLEERELAAELEGMLGALREDLLKADAIAREKQVVPAYRNGLDKALAFVATAERLLTDRSRERDRVAEARAKLDEISKGEDFRAWMRFYTDYADVRTILSALNATLPDGERFPPHELESPPEGVKALATLCDRYEALAAKRGGASQKLPPEVEALVAAEVASIRARQGPKESPIFTYEEDYTQYVPRGHYTRSELLKRYFVAMMYLGRMTFLVKGGEGPRYLVSKEEAKAQTVAAELIVRALGGARAEPWKRIYGLTGFFVGFSDDLSVRDYTEALGRVGGGLAEPAAFARFQAEVARMQPPAIYSGTGDLEYLDPKALEGDPSPEVVDRALAATQGFRLMGQRFTPDGYIHGRLVQPTVGKLFQRALDKRDSALPFTAEMVEGGIRRAFPRGLDVAAWLLGSKRAARLLADFDDSAYAGYAAAVARIERDVAALTPASWNGNLYYAWLHALRGLVSVEYGPGFPTYMQGDAWATKELATALGSWSQLRHDTILYVKQPYGMRAGSAPPPPRREVTGHVEPVPELYARLLALARFTRAVLAKEKALDDPAKERLDATEALLSKLLDLARHELAGKPLVKEDADWVKAFASRLKRATQGSDTEALKTTLVADVFTDGNTRQCLEVATGPLAVLVVLTGHPDGTVEVAAGPAFTTYEFKHPAADRLTDEAWRARLEKGDGCRDLLPDWTRGLYR